MVEHENHSEADSRTDLLESQVGARTEHAPEDWEPVSLGNLAQLRREGIHPEEAPNLPYVGLEHIDSGNTRLGRWGKAASVKSGKNHFYPDDVLYGKLRPYLDKAVLAEQEGMCSTDMLVLKATERVDPAFLSYLVHLGRFVDHAKATTSGVNHPRTSWASIQEFEAYVPAPNEQKAIANVLRSVQTTIGSTEQVIEATRELRRSLMNHLFTYGLVPVDEAEQVPLKETEIGLMPQSWGVARFGDVAQKPQYGYTASAAETPIGPKFLRITDIQDDRVNWSTVPFCECSEKDAAKYKLGPGDILFARIGATTGKSFLLEEIVDAVYASYLIRVRPTDEVDSRYLAQFTRTGSYWTQINAQKGGRLKQGVNIPVLSNLLLPYPPLSEQQQIAHALGAVDQKIVVEENRKASLDVLFKALLHNLMTGKIRVNDLEALALGGAN